MMRLLILLLLIMPLCAFSQAPQRPPVTLKLSLFELVNPFQQSVVVHGGIPLAPRWAIDLGIGGVFASSVRAKYVDETMRGIRLRPEIRYYCDQSERVDLYFGLLYKHSWLQNTRYLEVLRQGDQYIEWIPAQKKYTIKGLSFRFGSQFYFGKRKHLVLDWYSGLGIRQATISGYDLPPDVVRVQRRFLFNLERAPGIYTTPDIGTGVSLGWKF